MKGWGEAAIEGVPDTATPREVARHALGLFTAQIRRSRKHREARHRFARQALTAFRRRQSRNGVSQ